MKNITRILVILLVFLTVGCVSIPSAIKLDETADTKNIKVGVLLAEPKQADTFFTGSIGLLDLAIIYGMNESLREHLKTLEFKGFSKVGTGFTDILKEKGFVAELIEQPMPRAEANKLKLHENGKSPNDLSSYADRYDRVLLLRIGSIGTTRDYYGPLPTSEPVATATLIGELVDVKTKKVYWYQNLSATKVIPEPWDEQGYPNLTNSVYAALNDSTEKLKAALTFNTSNELEKDIKPGEKQTSGITKKTVDSSNEKDSTQGAGKGVQKASVL